MNQREAFKLAKHAFNKAEPYAMSSVCTTGKGVDGAVVIKLHNNDGMLVLWHKTDLERVKMMCELELSCQKTLRKKTKKRIKRVSVTHSGR